MNVVRRAVAGLLVGAVALIAVPGTASAHSELIGSSPAQGARPDAAVTAITLTFESPVAPDLADVVLVGADGERVVHEPAVSGSVVTVPVSPLDVAGDYQVSYRVVAADGHPVSGTYGFTVSQASAQAARNLPDGAQPAAGAADVATAAGTDTGLWWQDNAALLGLLVCALAIIVSSLVRRSRLRTVDLTHG
jgi:methionine-rich copper-binding protein CopC